MAYDKLIITDFETTGLDCKINEIIEIGAICVDHATLETLWEHEQKLIPTNLATAHPKALEVNGYNAVDWKDAVSFEIGFAEYRDKLDHTMIFTKTNVWFDLQFYLEGLRKMSLVDTLDPTPYGYSYHRLDVASMAFPFFTPPVYRMREISPLLGLAPESSPHRAIDGARNALANLRVLRRMGLLYNAACHAGLFPPVIADEAFAELCAEMHKMSHATML